MALEVHTEYQARRYFASYCSCGCIFFLVTTGLTLFLPLYIGVATFGFWEKDALVYEQPEVQFQNKLVLFAEGTTVNADGSTSPLSLVYTTSPSANSMFGDTVRQALLQSIPSFDNNDGRPDSWTVSAALPLQATESINSVQMAAFFDLTTHDVARVKMNGLLAMTASSQVAGSAATVYGSVALRQASRVPAAQGFLLADGGSQLVDLDSVASSSELSLAALMAAYSGRNYTMTLDTLGPAVWEADGAAPMPGAQVIDTGMSAPRTFTATIVARVNTIPIWVRPPMSQILKGGLVQYLALYFVVYYIFRFINSYLYGEGLVSTLRRDDLPGGRKAHMS